MTKLNIGIVAQPGTSREYKTGSWKTYKPVWLYDKCTGCGLCIIYCPDGCVTGEGKGINSNYDADLNYCKGCGICAQECPVDDIKMELEEK